MGDEPKVPFVMIIEDDRDVASYYRHVMDMSGYRTEIVANGKLAVENLYKSSPDVVLLDLKLPGISGVDVLKLMRADDRLKGIRVGVITGFSEIADFLPVAPDLVLMKPVSPEQLTDLVWRLFNDDMSVQKRPFEINPWDEATGLYNRPFFIHRLGFAIRNCAQIRENRFGVLAVSLERGDKPGIGPDAKPKASSLAEIAALLKKSVRPTDTLARFDGNGFYILVENIGGDEILPMIVERVRSSLGRQLAGGIQFRMGTMLCDDSCTDIDEILRKAQAA